MSLEEVAAENSKGPYRCCAICFTFIFAVIFVQVIWSIAFPSPWGTPWFSLEQGAMPLIVLMVVWPVLLIVILHYISRLEGDSSTEAVQVGERFGPVPEE